ncbi:hypothetical protein ES703_79035 [subsurface metagenome]
MPPEDNLRHGLMFESDAAAMDSLSGTEPLLEAFVATLALARVGYRDEIKEFMETIHFVPGFAFFRGPGSARSYYRLSACHEFLPSAVPEVAPCDLHVGVSRFDFLVQFMSSEHIEKTHFYEYFHTVMTFSQAREGLSPPKGGQLFTFQGKQFLRLFHHTSAKGKQGIISDGFLNPSIWNFCGTRELTRGHCYLTDIPNAKTTLDTLPLLMRTTPGTQIVYRTDDEEHIVSAGVNIENRDLSERIALLVAPEIIQPNPMVYHFPIRGQPTWLEIQFSHIYRCPCDGLTLNRDVVIDGEVPDLLGERQQH